MYIVHVNALRIHEVCVYPAVPALGYRRSGFNCEYLLIANCEFLYVSSSVAFIGFTIWPDLTTTQLLNCAIKTRPTVSVCCFDHTYCTYRGMSFSGVNLLKVQCTMRMRCQGHIVQVHYTPRFGLYVVYIDSGLRASVV